MEKAPIIIAIFIAIVAVVTINLGVNKDNINGRREISSYQYANLHSVIDMNPELAEAANYELRHDTVTVAEYNQFMRKVDAIQARKPSKRTASVTSRVALGQRF